MLVISVLLAQFREAYRDGINSGIKLTVKLAEMINTDTDLLNALTWSTNSKANLEYVFMVLKKDLFDKNLFAQ